MREHVEEPRYVTTDDDTVYSLLSKRAARTPDDIIAEWQDDNTHQWRSATATEMLSRVREVAKGLLGLGVKAGTMVLIYSPTCYEWGVADFACAAIGAVVVPVYETDSARQTAGIVEEVDPAIAFAGDFQRAQTLEQIRVNHPGMKYVFNFKADGLDAVVDFGHGVSDETLDAAIARIKADDLLTVVYTSGSTGKPKGAMLSNRNYTHIVLNGYEILRGMLYDDNRLLLFLPLAHCFARFIQYASIASDDGVVGYLPDTKTLLPDVRSFEPTYLLGVPRVFEKVHNAASRKAGMGWKGRLFLKAAESARDWSRMQQAGEKPTMKQTAEHLSYEASVYHTVRGALGPRIRYVACGGAPLDVSLAHFFNGIGLPMIQGYGMTETAAPFAATRVTDNVIGTVGQPAPGSSVRISDDGELQVKGPNVFMGYHNLPEKTAEVFTEDGWLRTGDLASIDDEGRITITGRKKDIIITAGGKNISPAPMEDIIDTCPIVSHAVVIGDGKPFISALIELDPDMTRSWLSQQSLDAGMSMKQVAENDAVRAFVQQYVEKANANVSRAESVRKFEILDEEFNQQDGTLTASLKVVRPKVLQRYADVIENVIYAPKPSNRPLPKTVQILDRTTETVKQASESMRQASESVSPKVRQAFDTMQERIKKQSDEPDDETAPSVEPSATKNNEER